MEFGVHHDGLIPNPREHLYVACSTVCNLNCVFCAYRLAVLKRQVMSNELFAAVVTQACDAGFEDFGLTPLTGEVFMDPQFVWKLQFLERHAGVRSYSFITNFTRAPAEFITLAAHLKKLRYLSISVYGHDELSFVQLTASGARTWKRLLGSLSQLARELPPHPVRTQVRIRSIRQAQEGRCAPELQRALDALREKNVEVNWPSHYYNWGGLVTNDDIAGLGVEFLPQPAPRVGPCAMIFYKTIVLPDGKVNACACRDAAATLVIGDLSRQNLCDVYSVRNKAYVRLIHDQMSGAFNDVCNNCNMFRSIYASHETYERHLKSPVRLADFSSGQ